MSMFSDEDLTCNDFLGGKLRLLQPRKGYRAGVDPVLLAAAVPARAGSRVLELGCGAGPALFCLAVRVPDLGLTGVEIQPAYASLAKRNAALNALDADIHCADLEALPDVLRQQQFDHVLANPPYFRSGAHSRSSDPGRQVAMGEETALEAWVLVAAKRLVPKGYMHMIHRIERLPDILAACTGKLGSIEVLPIAPRQGRAAELVLVRARKEGRAAFRLHAPLILHDGVCHQKDEDSYRAEISAILRQGAPLSWPTPR